jgi:hypothetical protein
MKKTIIALVLALTFIAPASASASDTATATAKLATKISLDAKAKAELAMAKALQAEKVSLKTVKDVEVLRIKTMSQLKAVKKQLDALAKLLKTL